MSACARSFICLTVVGLLAILQVRLALATTQNHLYVAVYGPSTPGVVRYKIFDGLPAAKPDWVYRTAWPVVDYQSLAVDKAGHLFAGTDGQIDVYDRDSHHVNRQIFIPQVKRCDEGDGEYVDSIAVDQNGYLFVATDNFYSGARRSTTPQMHESFRQPFCTGILVYAPGAHGNAMPVQAFAIPPYLYQGMTVDGNGNLFVSVSSDNVILEFANALANPTLTRTFQSPYVSEPSGLATDLRGDLYAMNYSFNGPMSVVDFYKPSSNGRGAPDRQLLMQGAHAVSGPGIALDGRSLYTEDATAHLEVYDAFADGIVAPLFALPRADTGGGGMTTGP